MSYDPQKSAREKTPWGLFQMQRTHLVTGTNPDPKKRKTAKQLQEQAAERERLAREARWEAAGCKPLEGAK